VTEHPQPTKCLIVDIAMPGMSGKTSRSSSSPLKEKK
jgi:FixJ family two-component response regulator